MAHSLSIVLGYACTFKCRHCAIIGPPEQKLSAGEVALLAESISEHRFETLLFVGGEPTLHIPIINDILRGAGYLPRVLITTNGWFAETADAAAKKLQQISGLNEVQLSYDKFHKEFLGKNYAENLKKACDRIGVRFSAILTIESPAELPLMGELRKFGDFTIGVQKVLPFGAASENGISYSYPLFDQEIFSQFCPNKDGMVYMCGRGFSVCDIPRRGYEKFFFHTVEELIASDFYRDITRCTFGKLSAKAGIHETDLSPDDSCPCVLCEKIFSRLTGKEADPEEL